MGLILKSTPALEPSGRKGTLRLQALYECPQCGDDFKALCSNVNRGRTTKCRKCAMKHTAVLLQEANNRRKEIAANTFITKAKALHGDTYDYTNTEYTDSLTKVGIKCKIHDKEFFVLPSNHLKANKGGCPICAKDNALRVLADNGKALKEKAAKAFIEEAIKVHGGKYDYSKVNYEGSNVKVVIICPVHGEFLQRPNGHISGGYGCPACGILCERPGGNGKYNVDDEGTLYLIELNDFGMYKIGITKRQLGDRLKVFGNVTIHSVTVFPTVAQAYAVEQYLLHIVYSNIRYTGQKVLQNGNTELITEPPKAFDFWVHQATVDTLDEVNFRITQGDL